MKQTVLTGIKPSGTPHLGNYVGAIRPCIEASKRDDLNSFYFLADYHSIISTHKPEELRQSTMEVAATWLAMGLDTQNAIFYRQSDIPEIHELTWMLTCMTAKGLMNRAHAYKARVQENEENRAKDPDKGITMGLYSYPVLMAADILMFKANQVPVGKDQVQHIEMARDIAARFNHHFGEHFVLPEAVTDDSVAVLSGLDGRKMSKSYNNTIGLFLPEKKLRKQIMKIKTNSLEPGEPKETKGCTLFEIFCAFATKEETKEIEKRYAEGIAWGEMKQFLFEYLNETIAPFRATYEELMSNPAAIEEELIKGRNRAREYSIPFIEELRKAVGFYPLG
ncbi:MAG: tryptophan--tRNA ligase [Desulfobacterales bacterium]|nr:tryptophan--tRNA ligase [Desulfobacterales bacterium]